MRLLLALLLLLGAAPTLAADPRLLTADQALQEDAALYAAQFEVSPAEALARLKQQQASIPLTDRLRIQYRDRLASIAVEHRPDWRVVVRLTGAGLPADFDATQAGLTIPVRFQDGYNSSRTLALRILDAERSALPGLIPGYRGAGVDPASGGLVVMQRPSTDLRPTPELEQALFDRLGIPVRIRRLEATMFNSSAIGGGRIEGAVAGQRYRCTTGFVVRNPAGEVGVTTAAHCPDELSWRGPTGEERALTMAGAWGNAEHDVQVHTGIGSAEGLVFSDSAKIIVRPITSWATRPMTRVGDWLCHRGESSGYACAVVELTDFAPPGELCGGLCAASWVTLAGPACRSGDSGAPIFLGSTAYGVLKGGAYLADRSCAFSYYQSVDYLPDGWRVVTAPAAASEFLLARAR